MSADPGCEGGRWAALRPVGAGREADGPPNRAAGRADSGVELGWGRLTGWRTPLAGLLVGIASRCWRSERAIRVSRTAPRPASRPTGACPTCLRGYAVRQHGPPRQPTHKEERRPAARERGRRRCSGPWSIDARTRGDGGDRYGGRRGAQRTEADRGRTGRGGGAVPTAAPEKKRREALDSPVTRAPNEAAAGGESRARPPSRSNGSAVRQQRSCRRSCSTSNRAALSPRRHASGRHPRHPTRLSMMISATIVVTMCAKRWRPSDGNRTSSSSELEP